MGTKNSELVCIRGSEHFLIVTDASLPGDQTYAAMYGNKSADISSRYHSVKILVGELSKFRVKDVKSNLEGYTIKLALDKKQIFQSVLLQGPQIYYTGPQIKETEISLTVKSKGKVLDSPKFKIDLETFKGDVEVKAKESRTNVISKGKYNLNELADIKGPIFSLAVDKNTASSILILTAPITTDEIYTPEVDTYLHPLGKIHVCSDGRHLGYAKIDAIETGVYIYIFEKATIYVDKFFLKNIKL